MGPDVGASGSDDLPKAGVDGPGGGMTSFVDSVDSGSLFVMLLG